MAGAVTAFRAALFVAAFGAFAVRFRAFAAFAALFGAFLAFAAFAPRDAFLAFTAFADFLDLAAVFRRLVALAALAVWRRVFFDARAGFLLVFAIDRTLVLNLDRAS